MALLKLNDEAAATGKVKAVFDDIKARKGIERVPNIWRALANHPDHLEVTWNKLKDPTPMCRNIDRLLAIVPSHGQRTQNFLTENCVFGERDDSVCSSVPNLLLFCQRPYATDHHRDPLFLCRQASSRYSTR